MQPAFPAERAEHFSEDFGSDIGKDGRKDGKSIIERGDVWLSILLIWE